MDRRRSSQRASRYVRDHTGPERRRFTGCNDQRTVEASRLLQTRVTMVPVGTGLRNENAIRIGGSWCYSGKTHARDAIHEDWWINAMPMDRRGLSQSVSYVYGDVFTLPPYQRRPRDLTVYGRSDGIPACDVDRHLGND